MIETSTPSVTKRSGRAMGTTVTIIAVGGSTDADALFARVTELERRWSRFNPSSEVSRLNQQNGHLVIVSPDTVHLVRNMMTAYRLTDGRYDPTMLETLILLGYDRSFEDVPLHTDRPTLVQTGELRRDEGLSNRRNRTAIARIEIMERINAIRLPESLHLDPGGIGKGLAGDLVADDGVAGGATGVLIDIGGDIVTRGFAPDGGPWRIEIASTGTAVELHDGAVATSDVGARSWIHDDADVHHLLDPDTGRPLHTIDSASIVAGSGWWADAMTKAAMVSLSRNDGWFDAPRAAMLGVSAVVTHGGTTEAFGEFASSHQLESAAL